MFQIGPREIGADLAFGVDLALFILQCSNRIWSAAYGSAAVAVCGFSFVGGNPVVITVTCGAGIGTAAKFYDTYIYTGKTLEKLDLLWKEAEEMRKKIGKYNVILELIQLRDED